MDNVLPVVGCLTTHMSTQALEPNELLKRVVPPVPTCQGIEGSKVTLIWEPVTLEPVPINVPEAFG